MADQKICRWRCAAIHATLAFSLALPARHALAQTVNKREFTTLGTACGPIPNPKRSQPANLLRSGNQLVLIDAGDGAAEQLSKVGVPLGAIDTVFISHLHFDHIGGLFALLSLRFQMITPTPVTIYGPVRTQAVVQGFLSAMEPALERPGRAPDPIALRDSVKVIEIGDGWRGKIGDLTVTAAVNTHYILTPPSANDERSRTLGFRFDMPDRSIVYTGDTGPSKAMETLARDADLLVTEIIDPDGSLADIKAARPNMPPAGLAYLNAHFHKQHLAPMDAGLMAMRSGAKALVLTHICVTDEKLAAATAEIAKTYRGPVTFARDLDRF